MSANHQYAPIILFVYNRPDHAARTLSALACNHLSAESDLIIFSDAARSSDKLAGVDAVRKLIREISGFRSVQVIERPQNFGLAKSIIQGVSAVLQEHESAIILEDDMITSPHFLTYMNEGLAKYAGDERVISLHAYTYPVKAGLPETFFLPGADCWGWATWRRGWTLFNPDGADLLRQLQSRQLGHDFDFDGSHPYTRMLDDQVNGRNDSWAIRWYASAFLLGKLTLYPGRSLVHNIGNDMSGTHSAESDRLNVSLSETPVRLDDIPVEASITARASFAHFFRDSSRTGIFSKLMARSRRLLGKTAS